MSQKLVSLQIPVKPHIQKYLEYKFPDGLIVSQDHYLGIVIFSMLRAPLEWVGKQKYASKFKGSTIIHLKKEDMFKYALSKMTARNIVTFNTMVNDLFKEKLHDFLEES